MTAERFPSAPARLWSRLFAVLVAVLALSGLAQMPIF